MGASESKLAFKEDIFRLAGEDIIPIDSQWWSRVCSDLVVSSNALERRRGGAISPPYDSAVYTTTCTSID